MIQEGIKIDAVSINVQLVIVAVSNQETATGFACCVAKLAYSADAIIN